MEREIKPDLMKIGTYLKLEKSTIFSIPEYQRAYTWQKEHCDKLWTDITDFIEGSSEKSYFFGTVIISCEENDTKYSLIDGQQRTTTFILLLKALLIRVNAAMRRTSGDPESESLYRALRDRRKQIISILYKVDQDDIADEPSEKDLEFYKEPTILKNHSINEQYSADLATILQAPNFEAAREDAITIAGKKKDNKYTNFFRNFKYFYEEKLSELSDSQLNNFAKTVMTNCEVIVIKSWQVEQAINMFNSLNSDGLPLFDSDIISSKLYAVASAQGKNEEFNALWRELKAEVSDIEETIALDNILMQHMYYVRASLGETVNKESGSINVTTPGLRRYFTEDNKELLAHPVELCQELINLTKSWKQAMQYPSVQVLLKFNENARFFLGSYFYRFKGEFSEEDIQPVAEGLLRLFVIMELVDTGYSSKYFKTFLFGEEVRLIDKSIDTSEITEDFGAHIKASWKNPETIEAAISDYDKNSLVYLNEYLYAKAHGLEFSLLNKYDIEHIVPQSGRNIDAIRDDAGISKEEFPNVVNKLGNKILLEQKINRTIGNDWFRTKVSTSITKGTGYVDSNYPLAKALVEHYQSVAKPTWVKEDINSATEKATARIMDFLF